MKRLLQITSFIFLIILGLELSGLSDLFTSLDSIIEMAEVEDSSKKEKEEKEEESKLFEGYRINSSSNLVSIKIINSIFYNELMHYPGTETPPPEIT